MMDLNGENLEREVARLRNAGTDVRGMVVDVTDRPAVHKAFAETAAIYRRLDVTFANAGIDPGPGFASLEGGSRSPQHAIENYGDERWNKVLDINLNGVFTTVKAAARHMKEFGNGGSIIITTSTAATTIPAPLGVAYQVSKAGAAHFMRNTALELARYQIRVNAIAPGTFATNIGGGWLKDPAAQETMKRLIPVGRVASTEEMKGLAIFLASKAAPYLTGVQIQNDGGGTLGVFC
jgi:NAD(P)-dependent dehydrogenase (short-subunit alcohol dehydrogenase family)